MRVIQDRYHAVLLSESAIPCGEDVLAIMISLSNCHNAARYGTPQLEAYIDCLAAQVLQPEELRCGALERNTRSFNGTDFASHKPVSLKPHMFTTGPSQRSSQTRGLLLLSLSHFQIGQTGTKTETAVRPRTLHISISPPHHFRRRHRHRHRRRRLRLRLRLRRCRWQYRVKFASHVT